MGKTSSSTKVCTERRLEVYTSTTSNTVESLVLPLISRKSNARTASSTVNQVSNLFFESKCFSDGHSTISNALGRVAYVIATRRISGAIGQRGRGGMVQGWVVELVDVDLTQLDTVYIILLAVRLACYYHRTSCWGQRDSLHYTDSHRP